MSFDKTGYQLTLFQCQSSNGMYSRQRLSRKWVCAKRHIILKNLYEFQGFGANRLMKNIQQKDGRRLLWMISERFKITTAAASECGLVWHTAHSYRWGDWRVTNGDDISGLESVQRDANLYIYCNNGCRMFSVNIFTLNWLNSLWLVVSCYSNAGVRFLDTRYKIAAVTLFHQNSQTAYLNVTESSYDVDCMYQKLLILINICWSYFENMAGVRFFLITV